MCTTNWKKKSEKKPFILGTRLSPDPISKLASPEVFVYYLPKNTTRQTSHIVQNRQISYSVQSLDTATELSIPG